MNHRLLTTPDAAKIIYAHWQKQLESVDVIDSGYCLLVRVKPLTGAKIEFAIHDSDWQYMNAEWVVGQCEPHMRALGWFPPQWLKQAMEAYI